MQFLYRMKAWTEAQALKKQAVWVLFLLAFIESSFFPIPPDVLLIAMAAMAAKKAYKFALICTLGSVLGGIFGYAIGYFLWWNVGSGQFSALAEWFFAYVPGVSVVKFESVKALYETHGFWVVFTAGFSPIPYKLITITAGVFKIPFGHFFFASLVSRAARFFILGTLFYFFGAQIKRYIDKYFEWLTLAVVVIGILGFLALKFL